MIKIRPISRYEAIFLLILPIVGFFNFSDIPFMLKIFTILLTIACIYVIGEQYTFTEDYLERSFFGRKRRLELYEINSVKSGIHVGTYIIHSENKKNLYFILDFSWQRKKRDLLFDYIKKKNPDCKFYV